MKGAAVNTDRTTPHTASRLARAVGLLAVLLGAVGGLPVGLWTFFGRPVPGHVPSFTDAKTWLDQVTLFPVQSAIQVLVIAAWIFWAVFTVQIAVQLPGVARDAIRCARTQTALPTSAHLNLAGRLLAAIAISFIATRGSVGAAAAATTDSGTAPAKPDVAVVQTTTNATFHVVSAGECLWDIASTKLGDPNRWTEIYKLNRHRVQADGGVLTDPDVIHAGWTLALPIPAQEDAPATSAPAPAVPAAAAHPVPQPSKPALQQASTPIHRPVAVRLGAGGYVSLTLGTGLAAAMAAATIRTRAAGRRHNAETPSSNPSRTTETETTLLQAAALLGHIPDDDVDPYTDDTDPNSGPLPSALAALKAPEALYIGVREGRPIPLVAVTGDGLALTGAGAHDAARALMTSALTAGGFLAGSAAFTVVTTEDDLHVLVGLRLRGHVGDRLIVCPGFAEALETLLHLDDPAGRPLLIVTPGDNAVPIDNPGSTDIVLLGDCGAAATVADVGSDGAIQAAGEYSQVLDRAEAYRLTADEARVLFDRVLAGIGVSLPAVPTQAAPPEAACLVAASLPDPQPASDDAPAASEATLAVNVLGPFQLLVDGHDVSALFRPMTAALLIQLAANRGGVTRSSLAADLWPDLDPDARKQRFKSTLSHARTALAGAHGAKAEFILEARPSTSLRLNPALIDVDAWHVSDLLERAKSRSESGTEERAGLLLDAIARFRGEFAEGHEHTGDRIADTVWLVPHREAYFHRLVDAHQDAADLLRTTDPDRAVVLLERAAELEPWNSGVTEEIIEIHVEQGQQHAAARRLRILTEHLAHLGTVPSPRLVALVEEHADGMAEAAGPR